ncbi:MAG: glycoside hydrolase family 28 protein [Bacteroidales bacterium]|nr:glycoside hydrolase family 28 protein [Bacteroidales bacterium]MDD4430703.1 glycoside hydrolase family 28 protein [Bacteroidales bacterium]
MKHQIINLLIFICFSALLACKRNTTEMDLAFRQAAQIERSIKQTSFPDRIFSILDYGALAGDSCFLNHEAINKAILECSLDGGGTVIIPAGEFYTGPIRLKSNVNLHLEKEAVLKFSTDTSLYLPQVLTRWEGVDCYNYHPLVYAYGETNIALTGHGVLDAQGQKGWWSMCGARHFGWTEGLPGQNQGGRNRLLRSAEEKLDISQRIMTPQDALRPQMVNFYRCKQILIEGITLLNSPFWVLHPLLCEDLTVRGVHIYNRGPNGDGCDPESCKNVLIEDCLFDTGDDCIAIKSGRNNDGRKWATPSENIIVRNCNMKNGHGGVVIGSEISGGYRNLFVENCDMDSPDLDRVIRIKTNTCRGGLIENIFVRNVKVGQCREAVLKINLLYESRENCQRDFPPTVRNVLLENITCEKSRYGVLIAGLPGDENVYHIGLKNCQFNGVERGNSINGARDVDFDNLVINGELVEE